MRNELLPDSQVDDDFHWLQDNFDTVALARGNRLHLEDHIKHFKAKLMEEYLAKNPKLSIAAQERSALADVRYAEYLEGKRLQTIKDERMRNERETRLARIDAWRSASSNRRASI